jgi:uridylate kinase
MKRSIIVLSLGGSLIIPEEVNTEYLKEFKKIILKNLKKHKFIIVCGGGSVARKYISALRNFGINEKLQSFSGISATRMNARFMNYFFNINPEQGIPHTLNLLKEYIKRGDVVFCGALEYKPNQTSDSTAAQIASALKCSFVNLTDVPGLHDKNPKEHKDAKLIPQISWENFNKLIDKIKFKPGQHFVLDQNAAKIIKKNRITTYILGKNMNEFNNLLKNKKFKGTTIGDF